MRIPIYTVDLADKHGFKRIAKKLQRSWPSAVPLKLSSAQEILSRGFGYRDFYDLRQSLDECNRQLPGITQSEVRDEISTSIFVFCKSRKITDINFHDLIGLVAQLPLQELSVFQNLGQRRSLASTCKQLPTPLEVTRQMMPEITHQPITRGINPAHEMYLKRTFPRSAQKLISDSGLLSIWNVVLQRGILRDQCLFSALLIGVRPNQIKDAQVCDISRSESSYHVDLHTIKAREQKGRVSLPRSHEALFTRYIKNAGFSNGDHLFPSNKDASRPMSSYEINKLIRSYLLEALGNTALASAHVLRSSAIVSAFKRNKIPLAELIKSIPESILSYYLAE